LKETYPFKRENNSMKLKSSIAELFCEKKLFYKNNGSTSIDKKLNLSNEDLAQKKI
jgi:hypothetical protein